MKVSVEKLKNVAGIREKFTFSLSKEELGSKELPLGDKPFVFQGEAESLDRVIRIKGEIRCTLQGVCDRCGEPTEYEVITDFSEAFTNLAENATNGEEENETHLFQGETIDLLPYWERAVFFGMPMKILCKEACLGLCPQCGSNLNKNKCSCDNTPIDPRLAVLGDLLKEND